MKNLAKQTLGFALFEAARLRKNDTFIISEQQTISFSQLYARSEKRALALLASGIGPGDRVGLLMLNQLEWLELFFAVTLIGATVVGLSPRYRDSELSFIINDSNVKVIFTLNEHDGYSFINMFERLGPTLPSDLKIIPIGGIDWDNMFLLESNKLEFEETAAKVTPSDLAMVIYTSGTTGRPKGAGLTHMSMLAAAQAQAEHMRISAQDLIQLAMPLNHVGGISCGILAMLLAGGIVDLIPEFKTNIVLERMKKSPPTMIVGVPTMMTLLLMKEAETEMNLSGVRLIFVGGSNADAVLLAQLQRRMPQATVMNLYGMSETSGAIVLTPWDCSPSELMSAIGCPIGNAQVRVVGVDNLPVAPGNIGELCFRGAGVVPGYIGTGASNEAFSEDGWLNTGDLGRIDERGLITLVGRAKDMYIQGGFNIYPAEIEGYISRHPAVAMVAGIGISDKILGEVGCYFIVKKHGADITTEELKKYCAEGLADYKVPRQFVFLEEFPMTPAGKIHKASLRHTYNAAT